MIAQSQSQGCINQSCLSREKRGFFGFVFYQVGNPEPREKIEHPAGEAKVLVENQYFLFEMLHFEMHPITIIKTFLSFLIIQSKIMKKKYIYILLGFFLFTLAAMTLRPVIIPKDAKECLVAEGKVIKIFEGGVKDVAFRLEGDKTLYYINRGLEQGLNLEELRQELIGNNVTIKYPKHWTLLDPNNTIKHLSILEYNGREIFNEIDLLYNRNG